MKPEKFIKKYFNADLLKQLNDQKPTTLLFFSKPLKSLKDVQGLANVLESYTNITGLQLFEHKLTDEECKIIANAIAKSSSLTLVNLTLNQHINTSSWSALMSALSSCKPLSSLSVYLNKDVDHLKILAQFLPKCLSLTSLNLSCNPLFEDGIKILAPVLPKCAQLSYLQLQKCFIGDAGVNALASVLPQCHSLATLNLNENCISLEGLKALSIVLPALTSLTNLHLAINTIGSEGLLELFKVLPKCEFLAALNLANNKMNENALQELVKKLPEFSKLVSINLNYSINFNYNEISKKIMNEFAEILTRCPTMIEVELYGGQYSGKDIENLTLALSRNLQKCQGLLNAAANNNMELVQQYLQQGTSIWSRDKELNTALHLSAAKGHMNMARFLVEREPKLLNCRNMQKTPLQVAQEAKQTEMVEFLKQGFVHKPQEAFSSSLPKPTMQNNNNLPNASFFPPYAPSAPTLSILTNPLLSQASMSLPKIPSEPSILGAETDSMAIPLNQLVFGEMLGEGGFGKVFKGYWNHTKLHRTPVAIKQLKLAALSVKLLTDFKREVDLHSQLESPYIVKLYGITKEQPYCMVMELLGNGSLRNVLDNHSPEDFSWESRLRIAKQMAKGLLYLHNCQPPMIHGDLKSLNILVDDQLNAKVGDFGLSTLKLETLTRTTDKEKDTAKGSLLWLPPELFRMNAKKNTLTDMYSFAIVLWELASHLFPYMSASGNEQLIQNWITQGERESFDERTPNTPVEYQALTERCWSQNPSNRLSAKEAVEQLEAIPVFGKNPKAPTFFAPAIKKVPVYPENYVGNQYVGVKTVPAEKHVGPEKQKKTPTKNIAPPPMGNFYH